MNSATELLRELVAIPSVNPSDGQIDDEIFGEARMVDYLCEFLSKEGIDCARQEAVPGRENLVAVVEGQTPELIILEAHTDTVSAEGMTDPFCPRFEGGRIHGRGACDDKASLAAMVTALCQVAKSGKPERTCVLAATCDEEYRFSGVNALMEHPGDVGLSKEQLAGAMACAGEPTGLDIVIAHKGAFRWRMRTHGKAAHSSDPSQGENAIYAMASLVQMLQEYADSLGERPEHPLVKGPTFSVGVIQGGSAVNIVPDQCEVLVDRRLIPGEDGIAAEREIRDFIGGRVEYEMTTLLQDWPLETPRDAPIVTRAVRAAEAVLGRANITGVQYGTDASKMERSGVQCIVCGPGSIAQAHTVEEWVEVSQVEDATRIYERILTGQ